MRPDEGCDQPCRGDDERQDREPEREHRDMVEDRASDPAGHEMPVHRLAVDAERAPDVPGGDERDRESGEHRVGPREDPVTAEHSTAVVQDEDHRGDDQQCHELRARQHCERDPEQSQHVVPVRRARGRRLQREHRPQERRICRDLGQEERRVDDPRHEHGEQRHQVGDPLRAGHPACEQEGGDRRGAHHPGVDRVGPLEVVRHEAVPVRGCDQQGIELIDDRDEPPVEVGQRRTGAGDRQREALVEQLVGHVVPVDDAGRDRL